LSELARYFRNGSRRCQSRLELGRDSRSARLKVVTPPSERRAICIFAGIAWIAFGVWTLSMWKTPNSESFWQGVCFLFLGIGQILLGIYKKWD
jgi:hypothetical protein